MQTLKLIIKGTLVQCRLVYTSTNGRNRTFVLLEDGPKGWCKGDSFRRGIY